MRIYKSIFNSLWCVIKGLAVAPPGIIFIIGVSTSKNPSSSRNLRTYAIIFARIWKVFLTLSFNIRSK